MPPGPEALAPARPRLGQFPLATLADVARLPGKPSGVTQALCSIRDIAVPVVPRASSGFSRHEEDDSVAQTSTEEFP